jgi:hypothetical protein
MLGVGRVGVACSRNFSSRGVHLGGYGHVLLYDFESGLYVS